MCIADHLVEAAEGGDVFLVARLLAEGAAVDARNSMGRTALDLASFRGHPEVVRLLITAGADPEQPAGEHRESTPLCLAAAHGRTAVVEALIDAGVHLRAQGRMRWVPLVLAATSGDEGHPRTVTLLLDRGADINAVMKGRTSHEWAARFGQVQMVRRLLGRGATPTAKALTAAHEYTERHPESQRKNALIIDALRVASATAD
ncbi:ankyrin repeat domain-containing protein [Streptomyces sp. NBC_01433]|uniref:ankyrin repeat domain-containing protein n=1 Tax=Streptomyces sp. NBC_01433 TaxID=2903864 RepID=UPI00225BDCD1|nr:ankyrin repeat domain-containing protein [Streptomyces sp. NBC_01433]MCX4679304.1 ankyrin repeat domain-containing protein [Streptomyces sp. NBC_01433]